MKLGEALTRRADMQTHLADLRMRINNNVSVQEGDQPAEQPEELLVEAAQVLDSLEKLIVQINQTNLATHMENGMTLMQALTRRDLLATRINTLRSAADASQPGSSRYSRTEIKYVSLIDSSALRKQADDFSAQRRDLDTAIQTTNWVTDLVE